MDPSVQWQARPVSLDWLLLDGEAAKTLRAKDWSHSPLGDPGIWPETLKRIINTILSVPFPMAIHWGADPILFYNDAYIHIAGKKHPEGFGNFSRLVWPETWQFTEPLLMMVITEGRAFYLEDQHFRINRAGFFEDAHFTFSYSPIPDERKAIGGVLVVLQETSPYIRTQRDLIESRMILENIINSSDSHVFTLNRDHQFTLINKAMERFLGEPAPLILGKSIDEVFPERVSCALRLINEGVMNRKERITYEEEIYSKKNPEARTLITSKFPLHDQEGKVIGVGGVATDITERKQLEQSLIAEKKKAEAASVLKSRFLDTAAHELRTPVTIISLTLEVLRRLLAKGERIGPSELDRLNRPVDRLSRLIIDLLDISRLERGLLVLKAEPTDLHALCGKALNDAQIQDPDRALILKPTLKPIIATLDPMRIEQVLINLLDNAIKYTPHDSPIEIQIEEHPNEFKVSVIDQGPGIPQEQLPRLFSSFSRGETDRVVKTSGLGLGLSVCKGIIDLHDGIIGVTSTPGKGSTFHFTLPKGVRKP